MEFLGDFAEGGLAVEAEGFGDFLDEQGFGGGLGEGRDQFPEGLWRVSHRDHQAVECGL